MDGIEVEGDDAALARWNVEDRGLAREFAPALDPTADDEGRLVGFLVLRVGFLLLRVGFLVLRRGDAPGVCLVFFPLLLPLLVVRESRVLVGFRPVEENDALAVAPTNSVNGHLLAENRDDLLVPVCERMIGLLESRAEMASWRLEVLHLGTADVARDAAAERQHRSAAERDKESAPPHEFFQVSDALPGEASRDVGGRGRGALGRELGCLRIRKR